MMCFGISETEYKTNSLLAAHLRESHLEGGRRHHRRPIGITQNMHQPVYCSRKCFYVRLYLGLFKKRACTFLNGCVKSRRQKFGPQSFAIRLSCTGDLMNFPNALFLKPR